jgi:hypothetical protein
LIEGASLNESTLMNRFEKLFFLSDRDRTMLKSRLQQGMLKKALKMIPGLRINPVELHRLKKINAKKNSSYSLS